MAERTYNVPLRRAWLNVPKYTRAKKAVSELKRFLKKHMKGDEVKIGRHLNEFLWKHGIKNPPHHVKVNASKDDKGVVMAELVGAPVEKKKESEKEKKKREKEEKKAGKKEKAEEKPKEGKEEKTPEEKKVEEKEIKAEKTEIKEVSKKTPKKEEIPSAHDLAKKKKAENKK